MRKLDNAIKENLGTQMGEWLSELRQLKKSAKKGTVLKQIWMIDIQTQIAGKEYLEGCGYSPCFFGSLSECEKAIRAVGAETFKELEKNNNKPRIISSFDSDKIAKGACRIYYTLKGGKNCIREFRPVAFGLAENLAKAKEMMGV